MNTILINQKEGNEFKVDWGCMIMFEGRKMKGKM